jgi:hypothetical protein
MGRAAYDTSQISILELTNQTRGREFPVGWGEFSSSELLHLHRALADAVCDQKNTRSSLDRLLFDSCLHAHPLVCGSKAPKRERLSDRPPAFRRRRPKGHLHPHPLPMEWNHHPMKPLIGPHRLFPLTCRLFPVIAVVYGSTIHHAAYYLGLVTLVRGTRVAGLT